MTQRPTVIPDRVVSRVLDRVVEKDGCLISTYTATHKGGYRTVTFSEDGVRYQALVHRVAWIAKHGPIPADMTVHHKCFTTACVNVDHLALLPHFENSRRHGGRDWELGTCARGHDNALLTRPPGARQRCCAACRREDEVKRNERVKAERRASRC